MSITLASPTVPNTSGWGALSRWVDRFASWIGLGNLTAVGNEAVWGWGFLMDGETQTEQVLVSERSAMGLPAFGRGVSILASAIAGVDLLARRLDPRAGIDLVLDVQPQILSDPIPWSDAWHWRWGVMEDLILYGNHVSILHDPGVDGWPTTLDPVDVTTVELGIDKASGMLVWKIGDDTYAYGSVLHISAGCRSGQILGRGVIGQYRDALSGVLGTDLHARKYFRGGGLPSAVLSVDNPDLTQGQADSYKAAYRRTVSSAVREPMVVPSNVTFTPIVSDADKQQLVQAREFDTRQVALMLGIPVHLFGLSGASMTYQNVVDADIAFVRDAAARWSQPIEAAVSKWLLPPGQKATFDWELRLRTDPKTRAEWLKVEIEAGTLTLNEARRLAGRAPLPDPPALGGDVPHEPPMLAAINGQEQL